MELAYLHALLAIAPSANENHGWNKKLSVRVMALQQTRGDNVVLRPAEETIDALPQTTTDTLNQHFRA